MKILKQSVYLFWIISVIGIVGYIVLHPDSFSVESITASLGKFQSELLLVYAIVSILRGIFLLPATPFVLGGAVLFPEQAWLVLLISMLSVFLSSTAIYYFSDLLGFSKQLEARFPKQLQVWKARLSHPRAVLYVLGSTLIPIFSNELICYVAGLVKMPFLYVIFGVMLSSFAVFYVYIYFGKSVVGLW
ncbi:MAG: VTT domain-containing protein [Bacteroidota bacterium]